MKLVTRLQDHKNIIEVFLLSKAENFLKEENIDILNVLENYKQFLFDIMYKYIGKEYNEQFDSSKNISKSKVNLYGILKRKGEEIIDQFVENVNLAKSELLIDEGYIFVQSNGTEIEIRFKMII